MKLITIDNLPSGITPKNVEDAIRQNYPGVSSVIVGVVKDGKVAVEVEGSSAALGEFKPVQPFSDINMHGVKPKPR